jgi:hypothetical protein
VTFRTSSRVVALAIAGLSNVAIANPGPATATPSQAANMQFPLQPLTDKPGQVTVPGMKDKVYYVPSTLETIQWGYLPNAATKPVLTIPSGATVVFDTLSHEGLIEDQGHDPVKYFGGKGIRPIWSSRMQLRSPVPSWRMIS